MVHTTSNPSVVDRSARHDARYVTCGRATITALKVRAHRAERRAVRRALRAGDDVVPVRRVTGWEVA